MGTYEATSQEEPKTVNVHLANSIAVIPSDDSLSRALTKFWEVEEPPVEKKPLSSEEKRVVAEYAVNHVFHPNATEPCNVFIKMRSLCRERETGLCFKK